MINFRHINKAMNPLIVVYNSNLLYEIRTKTNELVEIAENVHNQWTLKEDAEYIKNLIIKI